MTTQLCRTCKYWSNPTEFMRTPLKATAHCEHVEINSTTFSDYACELWQQRTGEPLGTGLSRFWWHPALFLEASIVHDLQYDLLKPGESTLEIDREWHRNALLLADSWAMRRVADVGYLLIRLYGVMR